MEGVVRIVMAFLILTMCSACGPWLKPLRVVATHDARLVPQLVPNSKSSKIALAGDGRLALVGSQDGSVAVWQLEQRTLLGALRAHEGEVIALAITGFRAWSIGRKGHG